MTKRRFTIAQLFLAVIALNGTFAQSAENYPTRPVRVIVRYAPGGPTDIVARQLAAKLSEVWGQQMIVDNRTGASGNIALELTARATPDGYTLMLGKQFMSVVVNKSPAEFQAFVVQEVSRWGKVVTDNNIVVE